jgi:hypothetical protein
MANMSHSCFGMSMVKDVPELMTCIGQGIMAAGQDLIARQSC